jgi:predicted RNase H-like HicB family nuclease
MKKQAIKRTTKSVEVQVDVLLVKEGEFFVAFCPSLNISSYGDTDKDAKTAFDEIIQLCPNSYSNIKNKLNYIENCPAV